MKIDINELSINHKLHPKDKSTLAAKFSHPPALQPRRKRSSLKRHRPLDAVLLDLTLEQFD